MTELSILIYSDLKLSDYFRNETFVPKWLSKDRFIFSIHIAWKYEIEGSESIVGKSLYAGCININLITAALKNIEGRMIFFFFFVIRFSAQKYFRQAILRSRQWPSHSCLSFIISPVVFLTVQVTTWNYVIFIQVLCTSLL